MAAPIVNNSHPMTNGAASGSDWNAPEWTPVEGSPSQGNLCAPAVAAQMQVFALSTKIGQSSGINPFIMRAAAGPEVSMAPIAIAGTFGVLGSAGRATILLIGTAFASPWVLVIGGSAILLGIGAAYLYNYEKNKHGTEGFTATFAAALGIGAMRSEPVQPNEGDKSGPLDHEKKLLTPQEVPLWKTLVPEEETRFNEELSLKEKARTQSKPDLAHNPCLNQLMADPERWNKFMALRALTRLSDEQNLFLDSHPFLRELYRLILHSRDGSTGPLNDVIGRLQSVGLYLSMCTRPGTDANKINERLNGALDRLDTETVQRAYEMIMLRQQIIEFVSVRAGISALERAHIDAMLRPFTANNPALSQCLW